MSIALNTTYTMNRVGKEEDPFEEDHFDGEPIKEFMDEAKNERWFLTKEEYERLEKPEEIMIDTRGDSIIVINVKSLKSFKY